MNTSLRLLMLGTHVVVVAASVATPAHAQPVATASIAAGARPRPPGGPETPPTGSPSSPGVTEMPAASSPLFDASAATTETSSGTIVALAALEAPENIVVLGRRMDTGRIGGSAHRLNTEVLNDFEYDDILRVLTKVPGVYVRDEDGFGLRPNIGLRGANSDRSSRVVLMEDGVLLGPAPYSAPAAYFLPLMTRMTGVEVFKGPASIRYGPYTVGGAIDLLTADVPTGHAGVADVAVGQFGYGKIHGRYGWGGTYAGVVVEGVRLATSGFKTIDDDESADTGFVKNEVMFKARLNSDPGASTYHRLDIKLGYADEVSNETYLGLTDEDFDADPFRRYRGSQLARMDWTRTQAQVSYGVAFGDTAQIKLTAYRHDFERAWLKLNRFRTLGNEGQPVVDVPVESVLTDPTGNNELLLRMARGQISSQEIFSQPNVPSYLGIGTNDRAFVSQGIQLEGEFKWNAEWIEQNIRIGARVHYDEIKRRHDEAPYEMVIIGDERGEVVRAGPIEPIVNNDESTLAIALYLLDEMTIASDLILTPGVRTEIIETRSNRLRSGDEREEVRTDDSVVFIPGIGAYYEFLPWVGLVAGVHRGFSPVAPGQLDSIDPETSWNYEAGLRFKRRRASGEIIGFFNDYTNLLVTCTFSGGCPNSEVGLQFNAGDITVLGFEASAHYDENWGPLRVSVDGAYTFTQAQFDTAFVSGSPQYQDVDEGDALPYLPVHQAHVSLGFDTPVWRTDVGLRLAYTFVDRMRNEASQGNVADALLTDAQHIVDATLQVDFTEEARLYARIDNLLNQQYIASRRPFGARPGKPFQFQLGFTYQFGDQ